MPSSSIYITCKAKSKLAQGVRSGVVVLSERLTQHAALFCYTGHCDGNPKLKTVDGGVDLTYHYIRKRGQLFPQTSHMTPTSKRTHSLQFNPNITLVRKAVRAWDVRPY